MKNYPFLSHGKEHQDAINSINSRESLRTTLSVRLGLDECMTFRKNTTLVIIDVLSELMKNDEFSLVYSDLEHPCIIDVIEFLIPANRRRCVGLFERMLNSEISQIEECLSQSYFPNTVYFFSHVLWNSGIVLNVELISNRIKERNTNDIVLVDGAQAVGCLKDLFTTSFNKTSIDIYFGCTHKWLNTRNLLGFASFNSKLRSSSVEKAQKIFLQDIFSEFAGQILNVPIKWLSSTFDLIHLLELLREISNYSEKTIDDYGVDWFEYAEELSSIFCAKKGFLSFYGKSTFLNYLCEKYVIDKSHIIADANLPQDMSWLRLSTL